MSTEYPKIQTVYLRDPETKHKTLLRGQYALTEFEVLGPLNWEWTEKIDGTNIRIHWDGEHVRYKGRTDRAQIPTFLLERLQSIFEKNNALIQLGDNVTLYGEGYGARIQKSGGNYIPDGVDFILFDAQIQNCWVDRNSVYDLAQSLTIRSVPVVGYGPLPEAVAYVADGFTSKLGSHLAEGLIMRPPGRLFNHHGHPIMTKVKYKDFPR